MIQFFKGDITEINADVIVNASNSVGWMGGFLGRYFKLKGVAEAIHYLDPSIEKEAKRICKETLISTGNVFITSSGKLDCKYLFHAVTMKKPGSKSSEEIVEKCVQNIMKEAELRNCKTVALPLLATGTGKVKKEKVLAIFDRYLKDNTDILYIIVTY